MNRRTPRPRRKAIDFVSTRPLSGRHRVHLDANAFMGLVLSSVETYHKECYGVLLGETRNGTTRVQGAVPYQTAHRTRSSVTVPEHRRQLVGRVLGTVSEPKYLGEFHSHVDLANIGASERLSTEDMLGVQANEIQILIALRKSKLQRRWRHNLDGSISGTTGPFFVKLRAFESVPKEKGGALPRVAALHCRYAVTTANRKAKSKL